jgi:hypothetical protein
LAVAAAVGLEVCLKPLIIIPIHPLWVISFHFHVHQKAIEKLLSECIIYAEHIRQGVESFRVSKREFFPNPNRQSTLGNGVFLNFKKKKGKTRIKKNHIGYAFLHPIYLVQFLSLPTHHQL